MRGGSVCWERVRWCRRHAGRRGGPRSAPPFRVVLATGVRRRRQAPRAPRSTRRLHPHTEDVGDAEHFVLRRRDAELQRQLFTRLPAGHQVGQAQRPPAPASAGVGRELVDAQDALRTQQQAGGEFPPAADRKCSTRIRSSSADSFMVSTSPGSRQMRQCWPSRQTSINQEPPHSGSGIDRSCPGVAAPRLRAVSAAIRANGVGLAVRRRSPRKAPIAPTVAPVGTSTEPTRQRLAGRRARLQPRRRRSGGGRLFAPA